MNRTDKLKNAADRLKEAQQLLLLAIEKDTISTIERDIILEKLRKAYDSIIFEEEVDKKIIIETHHAQPTAIKVEKTHEIPPRPSMPEIKPQAKTEPAHDQQKREESETSKKFERTSIFEPAKKIKHLDPIEKIEVEKVPEKPIEPQQPKEQSILDIEQKESIAEKFQGKRKFMTDSLSNQIKEKPVASKLQAKPVDDITKEIGVHDRFMFTKELFNGDSNLFEDTLNKVNQFNDIADALIYLQENFNWNENNKAANKFIELVRRKLLND